MSIIQRTNLILHLVISFRNIFNCRIKQNEFAKEINVNPTVLNQYIHEHRVPNANIFVRFEIHSGELIKAVDLLRLVDKEKEYQISHDLDLRKREAQYVSKKLEFTF